MAVGEDEPVALVIQAERACPCARNDSRRCAQDESRRAAFAPPVDPMVAPEQPMVDTATATPDP